MGEGLEKIRKNIIIDCTKTMRLIINIVSSLSLNQIINKKFKESFDKFRFRNWPLGLRRALVEEVVWCRWESCPQSCVSTLAWSGYAFQPLLWPGGIFRFFQCKAHKYKIHLSIMNWKKKRGNTVFIISKFIAMYAVHVA